MHILQGWLADFKQLEEQLRQVTGECVQLEKTKHDSSTKSDYEPIAAALTGMLEALNTSVIRAM